MRQHLSPDVYQAWQQCQAQGKSLDRSIADEIACAMKDWATELGATHFTHWFQPMTGFTAEKHDSFITPTGDGRILMVLSARVSRARRGGRLQLPLRRSAGHLRGSRLIPRGIPRPTPS